MGPGRETCVITITRGNKQSGGEKSGAAFVDQADQLLVSWLERGIGSNLKDKVHKEIESLNAQEASAKFYSTDAEKTFWDTASLDNRKLQIKLEFARRLWAKACFQFGGTLQSCGPEFQKLTGLPLNTLFLGLNKSKTEKISLIDTIWGSALQLTQDRASKQDVTSHLGLVNISPNHKGASTISSVIDVVSCHQEALGQRLTKLWHGNRFFVRSSTASYLAREASLDKSAIRELGFQGYELAVPFTQSRQKPSPVIFDGMFFILDSDFAEFKAIKLTKDSAQILKYWGDGNFNPATLLGSLARPEFQAFWLTHEYAHIIQYSKAFDVSLAHALLGHLIDSDIDIELRDKEGIIIHPYVTAVNAKLQKRYDAEDRVLESSATHYALIVLSGML